MPPLLSLPGERPRPGNTDSRQPSPGLSRPHPHERRRVRASEEASAERTTALPTAGLGAWGLRRPAARGSPVLVRAGKAQQPAAAESAEGSAVTARQAAERAGGAAGTPPPGRGDEGQLGPHLRGGIPVPGARPHPQGRAGLAGGTGQLGPHLRGGTLRGTTGIPISGARPHPQGSARRAEGRGSWEPTSEAGRWWGQLGLRPLGGTARPDTTQARDGAESGCALTSFPLSPWGSFGDQVQLVRGWDPRAPA